MIRHAEAVEFQREVDRLVAALNQTMKAGARKGLIFEADVSSVSTIGCREEILGIVITTKVRPEDIEP